MTSTTALPTHPRSGLLAIGWRKPRRARGETEPQPIWPIAGGSGTGDAGAGGDGGDGGAGDDGGSGAGDDGGDPTPLEQQALDAIASLKAAGAQIPDALNAVVKEFRDARKEAGNHRTAKTAEKQRADAAEAQLSAVLKALGVDGDDPPDADQLQAALTDTKSEAKQSRIELAAYKAAAKPKGDRPAVDADALLDSATFLKSLSKLDPSSDTFEADLESAIKTAADNNPLLVAPPGGGRRGPGQGPRQTPESRPKSMNEAIAARYK
ncbi:hypothetical protein G1H11_14175 [Phytoactinopolyspora alkaliphila]|uniref:Uncharacterized protein n=1 Tax=Phytoactinopolyspora alkaliphila TaxID=1783498 RepID=A0A6N9YN84_9ACTN|nr:hypothetical protein [Phytoactinopolyspora alkaliphila]NED96453.1 hypothetical protein [Phytoactinopolyspora alkaliphila]